jgi:hypothetical protein
MRVNPLPRTGVASAGPSRRAALAQAGWPFGLCAALALLAGTLAGRGSVTSAVAVAVLPLAGLAVLAAPGRAALAVMVLTPWFVYPATAGRFSIFLAVPVAGAVALLLALSQRERLPQLWRALPTRAYAGFVAVAVVTAVASHDRATGLSRVVYLVLFGAFAWGLATAMVSGRLSRRSVVRAVVLSGAIAGAAVTIQMLYGLSAGRPAVTQWLNSVYPLFGGQRAAGFVTRNWYVSNLGVVRGVFPFMAVPSAGQYLMLCLIPAVWLRRGAPARTGPGAALGTVALVLISVGLLSTFSRQSWVGAAVGLVALGARRDRTRTLIGVAVAVGLLAVLPIPGGSGTFGEYLLASGDTTTTSSGTRVALWRQAVALIPSHALHGVGPGLYGTLNPDPRHPIYYAHNVFLDVIVELGVAGAALLVLALLVTLRSAFSRGASLGFAMIVAFVAAGLFDDVLYFPRNGLLLSVAFALAAAGDRTPEPDGLGRPSRPRGRRATSGPVAARRDAARAA